jgi:solute:Na+ symporter, SSS family
MIYLLTMLVIGAWGDRMKGIEDFHMAGRKLRPVLLIGTFCATIVGASSTIGMAGLGFSKSLPGAWWMLSGALGMLVLAVFFAAKIRATDCYTLPELVGSFYGEKTRIAASLLIVISWLGVIAVQIVASGKVLGALFGGSETLFMAACAAVFILYTMHGGQTSVVRTDLVQFSIIITGIVVLFFSAYNSTAGHDLLLRQPFPTSPQMGGWQVISMVLVVGSAYLVGPDMYSRILSAYSPREAKTSAVISAMILIPLAFLIASLGVFAKSLYPSASPEQSIPLLMTGLLSPAVQGLVAAALLAAFMSSADTSLMTASSILTLDLYKKARPQARPNDIMKASRFAVLVIGACSLTLAITLASIIKTLLIAYTVFTSGLLLPVLAGFYKDRLGLTPTGALSALVAGGTTAIFLGQSYPLLGMAVSAIFLFGVSWLEKRYATLMPHSFM